MTKFHRDFSNDKLNDRECLKEAATQREGIPLICFVDTAKNFVINWITACEEIYWYKEKREIKFDRFLFKYLYLLNSIKCTWLDNLRTEFYLSSVLLFFEIFCQIETVQQEIFVLRRMFVPLNVFDGFEQFLQSFLFLQFLHSFTGRLWM